MRTIKDLKASLPQVGRIVQIGIRPARKAEIVPKDTATISFEDGLEGDHYSKEGGKRMITLIQKEHLEAMTNMLEREVNASQTRRNVVVAGINLNALHDTQFALGDEVILEGTGYCHPCSRMEDNLGPGGYNAMRGHGGITARVVRGGDIKTGDEVRYLGVNEG